MSEFSDKARTIGFVSRHDIRRTVDVSDDDGRVVGLSVVDDFGNIVTEYGNRQDVTIRTAVVAAGSATLEAS